MNNNTIRMKVNNLKITVLAKEEKELGMNQTTKYDFKKMLTS